MLLAFFLLMGVVVLAIAGSAAHAHTRRWRADLALEAERNAPALVSDPPPLRPRPIGSRWSLEIAIEAPDDVAVACDILQRVRS